MRARGGYALCLPPGGVRLELRGSHASGVTPRPHYNEHTPKAPTMVTQERWEVAQEYEQHYWQELADRISTGAQEQLDWYKWRADQLAKRLEESGYARLTDGTADMVEIGCGPIGVSAYFPARQRVCVDPLEHYYGSQPVLSALRNPRVDYRRGVGEALPLDDQSCDLAVIENCIDHTRDMDAVMREVRRVLRPDGVLYLTVNARTPVGFVVHRMLSNLRIDAGHPHTFTRGKVARFLESNGFTLTRFDAESYLDALVGDLKGPGMRPRIKGVLGTSEFLVSVFAAPRR